MKSRSLREAWRIAMAGDWIKVQHVTPDKPEVFHMAEKLGIDPDAVVGKLIRVWVWADQQTTNGNVRVSDGVIDRIALLTGFCECLREVGWINDDGFTNFLRHNGAPSKARAAAAQRVASHRTKTSPKVECNADVTESRYKSVTDVTESRYSRVTIPRPIRRKVLERDGNKCVYCGRHSGEYAIGLEISTDGQLHIDHVIPVSQGGDNTELNLVAACSCCNRHKTNKNPDECGFDWPMNPTTGERYGSTCNASVTENCYIGVTKSVTREEKRREEKISNTNPPLPPNVDNGGSKPANHNSGGDVRGLNRPELKDVILPPELAPLAADIDRWVEYLWTRDGRLNAITIQAHLQSCLTNGVENSRRAIQLAIERNWQAPAFGLNGTAAIPAKNMHTPVKRPKSAKSQENEPIRIRPLV